MGVDGDRVVRVAAVQTRPVYLDRAATLEGVLERIERASNEGAELVVLPEAMLSTYPLPPEDRTAIDGKPRGDDYWELFVESSVQVPGPEVAAIGAVARARGVHVVLGVNERDAAYPATIYNTAVLVGSDGEVLGRHRKICPVVHELLFYTRGAGDDIRVWETPLGRIGMAICFEHMNPLLRYTLAAQGEQIHCSLWTGTEISSERSMRHVIASSSTQTALEGRCFVVAAGQVTPADDAPGKGGYHPLAPFIGGSGVVGPNGAYLAGPVYGEEAILYAELRFSALTRAGSLFSPFGKDGRPDLFELRLRGAPVGLGGG